MSKNITSQIAELAYEAGVGAEEVDKEDATYELNDGTSALNPGYFTVKDTAGNTRYFIIEDESLENNIDLVNLSVNVKKLNALNIIKGCVIFFTVLAAIAVLVGLIFGIQLGSAINALK